MNEAEDPAKDIADILHLSRRAEMANIDLLKIIVDFYL